MEYSWFEAPKLNGPLKIVHDDELNEKKKKKKGTPQYSWKSPWQPNINEKEANKLRYTQSYIPFFFYHGYHTLTLRATTLYSNSRYNIFHKGNHSRLLLEIKVVQSWLQSLKSGDGISQNRKKTTKCFIFCHISTDL